MITEFGTKLRELREAKGIMPATIDEYLGIMHGSCTNWENGYSMPEEELIEDLASYFRVPMKELNVGTPLTYKQSGVLCYTVPGNNNNQRGEKRTMAKKIYTEEQKAEILKRAAETSIANAAKEFAVSAVTISRWKAADKTTAVKIETNKKTRAAGRKVKERVEGVKADVAEATKTAADATVAAEIEIKKETRKRSRKAKEKVETAAAEKKTRWAAKKADAAETAEVVKEVVEEKKEEVKAAAEEKAEETKKKTRAAGRKAKETVEKPVKKAAAKAKAAKMEIIVQSPFGHEISAEDIAAKFPKGTEKVYIRVDQNKLYWVGTDGTTGDVDIW